MFKIYSKTHTLLKKKSKLNHPFKNILDKIYNSTLNIYSNKGKVLYDFRKIRQNKELLSDIIKYIAEIDTYMSIVQLYKKHQYTKCSVCFPNYIRKHKPFININRRKFQP